MKQNPVLFAWSAPQFYKKDRSTDWYWIVGIITVIAVGLALWSGNYLFAAVLFIGGVMIMVLQGKNPGIAVVEISEKGIKVNGIMHPYESLESFWMFQDETMRVRILLHIARPFMPYFSIPIDPGIRAEDIHEHLATKIKEIEHKEPTTELLIRTFGL